MVRKLLYRGRLLIGAAFLIRVVVGYAQSSDLVEQSHQAKELMAEGRFSEAIPIYQKLVAALPGNPGLILNLGLAEEMAGQPQKAIPHLEAVLKIEPSNVPALTSLAMAELQLNRPGLAIAPLKRLVEVQPADPNARGMLAGAYLSLNRPEAAAEQYRKLVALSGGSDSKAWYGLGKAYETLATQTFDRLSKNAPQSPYVAVLLADTRLQRHQYRSAFFFYRQAEKQLPNLPGLHAGLAKVYESTGHADWASEERKREPAPDCRVENAECRFLSGDLLGAAKAAGQNAASNADLFWAVRAYNQLAADAFHHLEQMPESVELHELKAEILHGRGQDIEAAAEWRAALALSPNDPNIETGLATSLFIAHNYSEAIPILQKLLVHQPNESGLNFMLGESLRRTQQPGQALPYLTAAVKAAPQFLPAHAALGMAYAMLNQNAEAIPHLEKAISLDDDGSLHYSLARACRAAGQMAEAQKAMQEYQQIKQRNQRIDDELSQEAEITPPR